MHGSSQPLRPLLDSISERIQQQETRQMWNFPHPESLHPATVSFLVYLQILARLSQNSSCSAARCNFSSLCGSAQRGGALARTLHPSEPESQSRADFTCFISNLSEHLVISIMGQSWDGRDLPCPAILLGYFHLEKWAGQVISFQIFTLLMIFLERKLQCCSEWSCLPWLSIRTIKALCLYLSCSSQHLTTNRIGHDLAFWKWSW